MSNTFVTAVSPKENSLYLNKVSLSIYIPVVSTKALYKLIIKSPV